VSARSTREALQGHLDFLAELGVTGMSADSRWRSRPSAVPAAGPIPPSGGGTALPSLEGPAPPPVGQSASEPGAEAPAAEALADIRADIGDCTRCKLHTLGRRQVVFGVGDPRAALMFVGEAPGRDEDLQGEPFVGRAGQLLTKIIEAIGLTRDEVYIANVIKCRPPENRNPEPDEVATCEPFLFRQIASIRPRVIVALGTFAARALLKTDDPISRIRGRIYDFRGARLVATFHPAFLLRSPDRKRDTWEDMKKVRALLQGQDAD
jgi:DNA polymerase